MRALRMASGRRWVALGAVAGLSALVGCSSNSGGGGGGGGKTGSGGGGANYVYLSGNWEIQATPTSASAPFTALAGFINEQGQNPGVDDLTTAALQVQPTGCYVNATTIPMQGSTQGADLSLLSFPVNSQFLTIKARKDTTATHLTGTYSITGGCADGATGTIAGTEYADLTGTYSGSITGSSPAKTMQLDLTQFTQGTGDGVFLEQGSATFTGFACFTTGQLASQNGAVLGSAVNLTFTTNDQGGAQVVMAGTMDAAAQTLTLTSVNVNGGSCPGSQGAATLTKQ